MTEDTYNLDVDVEASKSPVASIADHSMAVVLLFYLLNVLRLVQKLNTYIPGEEDGLAGLSYYSDVFFFLLFKILNHQ